MLLAAGVPSPRFNAELLLMFSIGQDRAFLYGHPELEITEQIQARYQEALSQRARGVPAQTRRTTSPSFTPLDRSKPRRCDCQLPIGVRPESTE